MSDFLWLGELLLGCEFGNYPADIFEEYIGSYYIEFSPVEQIPYVIDGPSDSVWIPSGLGLESSLFRLAWFVAQKTQYFASTTSQGNRYYSLGSSSINFPVNLWQDEGLVGGKLDAIADAACLECSRYYLSYLEKCGGGGWGCPDMECETVCGTTPDYQEDVAAPLMRHAFRGVAGLYRLFWIKTHPTCPAKGAWQCHPKNVFQLQQCIQEPLGTLGWGDPESCPDGTLCDKATGKCVAPTSCNGIPAGGQCFPGGIIKKCVTGPLGESVVVEDCGAKGMSCAWTVSEKWHCSEGPSFPDDPEDPGVPDPVVPPKEAWSWPLEKCHKNRSFGIVVDCLAGKCWHLGVDLAAAEGTTVYSPAKGVVKETKYHDGYGGTVIIEHTIGGQTYTSVLGHLLCDGTGQAHAPYTLCTKMLVKEGEQVLAGTPVAKIAPQGAENGWYGEHLHWGVRKGSYKYGASDQCKWTYAGLGPLPGCTEEFITAEFYDPLALAGGCDGTPPAGIPTGGPTAPQLVGPEDASAIPVGWISFNWSGGPATKKFLTIRNLDTCTKVTGLDLQPVSGNSETAMIEVPGSYRWTVAAEQPGAPGTLGYASAFTFYACSTPLAKTPAEGAELSAGEIAFAWTAGEPAKPHGVAVRNVTAGGNSKPALYPAAGDSTTVPLTEPGTYEWWVYYDVKHWIDKSSTCPYQKSVMLQCESQKRTFTISPESAPKYSISVSVTLPAANQQYDVGTKLPAAWTVKSEGSEVSHVGVDLVAGGGDCAGATTIQSMLVSPVGGGDPGTLEWPIPMGMPGGGYRVRVSAWSQIGFSAVECSPPIEIVACKPQCTGKQCGPDGCGSECGVCPFPKVCGDGSCACPEAECTVGKTQCLGTKVVEQCSFVDGCPSWTAAYYCPVGRVCQSGQCKCAPQCAAKQCGADGCGGTCGSCSGGQFCKNGTCVTVCNPSCGGKQCGDNGCGGSCGGCAVGFHCDAGQCAVDCQKKCFNQACGPDGCGGVCGVCPDKCSFCSNGQCIPFVSLDCVDDNPCTKEICDDGVCQHLPKSGGGCQDKKGICTVGDHCMEGACIPTYELNCNDGNPCTEDSCSPTVGCIHSPTEGPCDDGNACTSDDTCVKGWCTGSGGKSCNDGDSCTLDACYPSQGCVNVPVADTCDDGDPCTAGDTCLEGVCRGLKKAGCDDGNPCTLDDCIPWVGCVHETASVSCDDGDPCTDFDFCMGGQCLGKPRLCDDGNECTMDFCAACESGSCSNGAECKFILIESPCDDGDPCTLGDHCESGSCQPGLPDCSDGIDCTEDTCMGEEGCWHEPVDMACDDGDPCTQDSCKPSYGCWSSPVAGGSCDDGDPCTLQDQCAPDGCFGTPLSCPAGTACLEGKCAVCTEGDSLCVGQMLWRCKGNEFVGRDCQAEGGTCVDQGAAGNGAICFLDTPPEMTGDFASSHSDASANVGSDGPGESGSPSPGGCAVVHSYRASGGRSCASGAVWILLLATGLILAIRRREEMKRTRVLMGRQVMLGVVLATMCCVLTSCGDDGSSCTPGERMCSKSDVLLCDAGGAWSLLKTCSPGTECVDGDCVVSEGACLPDCTGKTCGDDGCGGQCGTCNQNETCVSGTCTCLPDCSQKVCGDDGCGGSCGTCPVGKTCQTGTCVDCSQEGCTAEGITKCGVEVGTYYFCSVQDGCYTWDGPKPCKDGAECVDGKCQCDGDCTGLECGDDGCGGNCGNCQSGESCQDGVCKPLGGSCEGKECGDDGAGGTCGQCQGSKVCVSGLCECAASCSAEDEGCVDGKLKQCGTDESGCAKLTESTCPAGCDASGTQCEGCEKACAGKECGESQGCPCGACPLGMVCNELAGQCECVNQDECTEGDVQCLPDSGPGAYRLCKEDENGCGAYGLTQKCDDNYKCIQGQDPFCVCQPDCENKTCGDDKCGGVCPPGCGECEACQYGQCVCPAGSDECGLVDGIPEQACVSQNKFHECVPCGKCGSWGPDLACQANESCFDNKAPVCQCDPTIQCSKKQCGPDGCDGTCPTQCSQWEQCTADGQCECIKDDCEYDGQKACCPDGKSYKVCSAPATCGEWGDCIPCAGPFDLCIDGMEPICQCQPQCAGKECGPDGCNQGGICGLADCPGVKECVDGLCKCMGEPCSQNQKTCQGNSVASCVQKDGCWTWGTPTSCAWDEVCSDGNCVNKCSQVTCDDGNPCTNDSCANGQCSFLPNSGQSCSDGNSCTVGDVCQAGSCQPGGPKNCDDGNACTTDSCSAGSCKHSNVPDGTACATSKVCKAGTCVTDGPVAGTASCTSYKRGESTTCTLNGSGFVSGGTLWISGCVGYPANKTVTATKITTTFTWPCNCELMTAPASYKNPDGKKADWTSLGKTVMGKTYVTEHWPAQAKKGSTMEYGFNGCNLTTTVWIGGVQLSNIKLQAQDQVLATGKVIGSPGDAGVGEKCAKKAPGATGDDAWCCTNCFKITL